MSPIQCHTFSGRALSNSEIRERLGLASTPYIYVVATLALERARAGLAPEHQRAPDRFRPERIEPQLVFHKALRHFMDRPTLTRAEERVTLDRAIERVAGSPSQERLLKHDVHVWRDALAILAERGIDLQQGIPAELQQEVVSPAILTLLQDLQGAYIALQREEERITFEYAARDFLAAEFRPEGRVILDGFTFLTPLQRFFIERCLGEDVQVDVLFPYRAEQARGFAIMRRTYAPFAGRPWQQVTTLPPAREGALAFAQALLFGAPDEEPPAEDASVTLSCYQHRNHEIAACIRAIRTYLEGSPEHDPVAPNDIAIVTRKAAEFQALLQEEAELQRLKDAEGREIRLSVPPRQLLLTPLGRFVLALYESWSDAGIELDPDRFETILASGWLGGHVQETVQAFGSVREQVFANCRTREEWVEAFSLLERTRDALPEDTRVPGAFIDPQTVELWRGVLDQIEAIGTRLFTGETQSIGGHVRDLLRELERLRPEHIRQAEQAVVQRIREILLELSEASSLEMSSREFGNVLNGLVREYEGPAEEEDALRDPLRIWVTTPEGIDQASRKVVFYLGLDSERAPRGYSEGWPFADTPLPAHLEAERYMFLAVVRAASYALHCSYARRDFEGEYRPSLFLQEVATLLGIPIRSPETETSVDLDPAAPEPEPRPVSRARRRRYGLEEIAHFALCPFRYKLERLDPGARVYKDEFQLRILAQGIWLYLIYRRLEEDGTTMRGTEDARATLQRAMESTRPTIQNLFPGFRPLTWYEVRAWVLRRLEGDAEYMGNYPSQIRAGLSSSFVIAGQDRSTEVDATPRFSIQRGLYPYPLNEDLLREAWLIPGKAEEDGPDRVEVDGLPLLPSLRNAVRAWGEAMKIAFFYAAVADQRSQFADEARDRYRRMLPRLEEWIQTIEAGHFPKHPGEHCMYCPVRGDCLGLAERRRA